MVNELQLIEDHQKLVYKIVNSFRPKNHHDFEDYVSVANIGLIKAIRYHDPTKGKLSTIAWQLITQELIKYTKKNKQWANSEPITEELEEEPKHTWENFTNLTDVEKQILQMRIEGYKFREIADKLSMNKSTLSRKFKKVVCDLKKCNS